MRRARSTVVATLVCGLLLLTGCASGDQTSPEPTGSQQQGQVNAQVASSDLYVGASQRVSIGLILNDGRLVSFGSVDFVFSYVGTADAPQQPERGPSATAVYVPTPGTPDDGGGPAVTQPAEARGVYQAEDVTFDRAGFWQVDVAVDVEGIGVQRARTTFAVLEDPAYPAPGEPAPRTRNLTMDSTDAPLPAIDSRAVSTGEVPDPELHRFTIAQAIKEGWPAVVVFSTPVYCISQFCGPVTDVVQDLASRYGDRAVFIHVEIYRDHDANTINQAAADWLLREGDLTEPWVYLIGPDGTILDRWSVLFREDEVVAALEAFPQIRV